jgi:hypothetical protein
MPVRATVTGQITIAPPIPASDLRAAKAQQLLIPTTEPSSATSGADTLPVRLHVTQVDVQTPTGVQSTITADAVIPSNAGWYNTAGLQAAVQRVLDNLGAGHTWSGHLEVTEIGGPTYRVAVSTAGGVLTAVRVDPTVTWPADPA